MPTPPKAPAAGEAKGKGKKMEGPAVTGATVTGNAETQLTALMAALAIHQEALPDSIREFVQVHQQTSASAQAKALHKNVAAQASATKRLASLRSRRAQYLVSWKEYMQKLSESLENQLQEKADVLAGFDAEESTLLDAIDTAKATVLSLAGKEAGTHGEAPTEMDVSDAGPSSEERQKLQRREEALLQAVRVTQEDAAKEVASRESRDREGSRTPRRAGKMDAQSISSEEEVRKPFGGAHMSQFGQCGPSSSGSHSIALEDDYVAPQMATVFGIHWAFAVKCLELGIHSRLPDPRMQETNGFSFVEADMSYVREEPRPCDKGDAISAEKHEPSQAQLTCGSLPVPMERALESRPFRSFRSGAVRKPHLKVRFSLAEGQQDHLSRSPAYVEDEVRSSEADQSMTQCALAVPSFVFQCRGGMPRLHGRHGWNPA